MNRDATIMLFFVGTTLGFAAGDVVEYRRLHGGFPFADAPPAAAPAATPIPTIERPELKEPRRDFYKDGDITWTWEGTLSRDYVKGNASTCLLACSRVWRAAADSFPTDEQAHLWDYALACSDRCAWREGIVWTTGEKPPAPIWSDAGAVPPIYSIIWGDAGTWVVLPLDGGAP